MVEGGGNTMPAEVRSDVTFLIEALESALQKLKVTYGLSGRESEVLLFAAAGMHTKAVAEAMNCSPKTVEEYWQRIFRRFRKRSRSAVIAELTACALRGEVPDLRPPVRNSNEDA